MISKRRLLYSLMVLLITITVTICRADNDPAQVIQVLIGDKPIDMKGTSLAVLYDQVFAPVRATAEAMGGKLSWNSSTGDLTVSGPNGTAVLRSGSRAATINGTKVFFPDPPYTVDGRMYASDMFFNQMFNMVLMWDPYAHVYKWEPIIPQGPGVYGPPMIIYGPGSQTPSCQPETVPAQTSKTFVGEVVRVMPSGANPQICVRASGRTYTFAVAKDAVVLRGVVGKQAVEVPLGGIRPGDCVTVTVNQSGTAKVIRAQYQIVRGKVKSSQDTSILLDIGETLKVGSQTEVILPDNVTGMVQDIHAGDEIGAGISPVTGKTLLLKVFSRAASTQLAANISEDDQIDLSTTCPLGVGDVLTVTFKANPGGKATFTIPGVKSDIAMTETAPGTGIYMGEYIVQPGDISMRQQIIVNFKAATGESYAKLSRYPVTIQTVGGYLPRITNPHQGQKIASPLVIQGIAKPNSVVRVSITYRADLYLMLPAEGLTDIRDVRADCNGHWQTPPLSVAFPFDEDYSQLMSDRDLFGVLGGFFPLKRQVSTIYTVTAASVNSCGEALMAYSVEVTKKPGRMMDQ